ncbi:MAG TPA: N-acetyl-gamma-glutamyl-phosphate reductase [Vicinamibacterales bacterium]|nr:N-acetyl-gamma-glutamyl-phosphate reductase [Vicinamibacterales bacterium]
MYRVAVIGATGYAGQELIRLLARHPGVTLTLATASHAASTPRRLPALARVWDGDVRPLDVAAVPRDADVAFLALPEAASAEVAPALVEAGMRVVDLSGAFRLRDATARGRWYPATPAMPDGVAYGLTEFGREAIARARLVSNPGCYPTASLLALLPLAQAGLIAPDSDVVIDAKSGLSGAGKVPSERTHFSENHGSVAAYSVFGHRHTPEIEQELGRGVTFVPHLVPLDRGILASNYVRLRRGTTGAQVAHAFEQAYASAPFVRLAGAELPEIKQVVWSNFCDIGWTIDEAGGRGLIVSVIDNLVKGAAGSAVQNFNVMHGLDERAGLQ